MKGNITIGKLGKILYASSCILFLFAFWLGSTDNNLFSNIFFIITMVSSTIATIALTIGNDEIDGKTFFQLFIFWLIIANIWTLSFFNTPSSIIIRQTAYNGLIYININLILCFIICLKKISRSKFSLLHFIKNYGITVLIVVFYIFLNLDIFSAWNWTDSLTYARSIESGAGTWNFSLNYLQTFRLGSHVSYAYTLLLYIGHYIFPNRLVGVHIVNLIMAALSIFAFTAILHKLYPKMNIIIKALLTACLTFSPLFFGLSYTINIDFALFCFFIWFVWTDCYDYKIFKYISIMLVCFSKEFGICLVLGYLLIRYIFKYLILKEDKIKITEFIKNEIFCLVGPLMWLTQVIFLSDGWSSIIKNSTEKRVVKGHVITNKFLNTIHIDNDYIVLKLKELFIMNFSWIIIVVAVVFVVFVVFKKAANFKYKFERINSYELAMFVTWIIFIIINCIFFTYLHYRYLQLHIFFYMMLLAFIMERFDIFDVIKSVILVLICACFFIECYSTIDPLTLASFKNINIGSGTIITTRNISCGKVCKIDPNAADVKNSLFLDGTTYNRQMLGLQTVIEKALTEIGFNGKQLIMVEPTYKTEENTIYNLVGYLGYGNYYWNQKSHHITSNKKDTAIDFYYQLASIDKLPSKYDSMYFIDLPFDRKFDDISYLSKYNIESAKTIRYGAWSIAIDKISFK